ncbi:luciferase family oxidoreductase group 1 [Sinobaca qinghaiensis]|uniref:Luciferase family oxidoreductase group 1 n=1 Tax=Sinobaca qinghaiensis TaxID=342944 RepID=A0A419V987_9BACL|nr:LLM class flavin-dependent oxidoreductase [Sinobaca qinghaiensis]RKD76479.1 luciferase family oxidoreductase group 1 [Sinobaca qinghaiensis]
MKLSVLDQSPIPSGSDAHEALCNTKELAQHAEALGYSRFWVAEHHSTSGLAGTSPEILISHLATCTSRIRVGSGGVLLPQYSPYKVAENFKVLEALFPGRIDLGVGRSPGGGQTIRLALTDGVKKNLIEFPRLLADLQGFIDSNLPSGHPYASIKASPQTTFLPETWVLGLSTRGAKHAARNSAGFTYGHFINPTQGKDAAEAYIQNFLPSERLPSPAVNFCIFVVCAPTQDEADKLALSQDRWLLNVEKGTSTKLPSPDELFQQRLSEDDKKRIRENRARTIVGTPHTVKAKLEKLAEQYQADEALIITNIYDHEARMRSYTLLAEAFNLSS